MCKVLLSFLVLLLVASFFPRTASGQPFPGLPEIHDVSVFWHSSSQVNSDAWDEDWIMGFGVELAFLAWHNKSTYNESNISAQVNLGYLLTRLDGHLTESLNSKALLSDKYFGGYVQGEIIDELSLYGGLHIRLPTFTSGRAYIDGDVTSRYTWGGDGLGVSAALGIVHCKGFFVETTFINRYWPSLSIDAQAPAVVPSHAPRDMNINTLGVSVGYTFDFNWKEPKPKGPAEVAKEAGDARKGGCGSSRGCQEGSGGRCRSRQSRCR